MHAPNASRENARDRFATGSIETASGPRIVVMCFDRLDRDLAGALTAIEGGDHYAANAALGHAQDLIGEMATMLDVGAWEHAPALVSVYDYLLRLLAAANVHKEPRLVREARQLLAELGGAFRTAAGPAADGAAAGDVPAGGAATAERSRLSVQA